MAAKFVYGSRSHVPLLSLTMKFYSCNSLGDKVRIRSTNGSGMNDESSPARESDPYWLQRAQYQSNWKRIIRPRISYSASNFFSRAHRKSILDFHKASHTSLLYHGNLGDAMQRLRQVLQGIKEKYYTNITSVLIKRPFTISHSRDAGRGKILRIWDQLWREPNWQEKREIYASLCRISLKRAGRKIEFRVLEIKGTRRRETRNLISLFLAHSSSQVRR